MKTRSKIRSALLNSSAFAAVVILLLAPAALAKPPASSLVYPTTSKPLGKSYPEWTEAWWQWALALNVDGHPFDPLNTGCNNADQSGPVWFLALSPCDPDEQLQCNTPPRERSCTIPVGTRLFLGVVNAECSNLEGLGETEADQRECADFLADHIVLTSLSCTIDGRAVPNLDSYRFESSQFMFEAPTPWIFGSEGGDGTAVSDGYFLMIKPLSPGVHTLTCEGGLHFSETEGDPFTFDAAFGNTYILTVQ